MPAGAAAGLSETFPTPMEEPRKVIKAWYLGCLQVNTPGGMEVRMIDFLRCDYSNSLGIRMLHE